MRQYWLISSAFTPWPISRCCTCESYVLLKRYPVSSPIEFIMAEYTMFDLDSKEVVWAGENPEVAKRYVTGPRGQVELGDQRTWRVGDVE
jgi:hypothetical protein